MAQWIPKTAWQLSNLNKSYGVSYIGLNAARPNTALKQLEESDRRAPFFAMSLQRPVRNLFEGEAVAAKAVGVQSKPAPMHAKGEKSSSNVALLAKLGRRGVPMLDLRDDVDKADRPVKFIIKAAVPLPAPGAAGGFGVDGPVTGDTVYDYFHEPAEADRYGRFDEWGMWRPDQRPRQAGTPPQLKSVTLDVIVPLHCNDLLSGACNAVLPADKTSIIVVFADTQRRALSGFEALRRYGYHNIIVSSTDMIEAAAREP